MRADVELCAAPRGWRRRWRWRPDGGRPAVSPPQSTPTVMHGHWVVPGGAMALAAAGPRPLVVSLHGSDVYVAERHAAVGRIAAAGRSTAPAGSPPAATTSDSRAIALGAPGVGERGRALRRRRRALPARRRRPRPRCGRRSASAPTLPSSSRAGRLVAQERLRLPDRRVRPARAGSGPMRGWSIGGGGDLGRNGTSRAPPRSALPTGSIFPDCSVQDEVSAWLAAAVVVGGAVDPGRRRATSTGCPTSSWRRWPRARRW